MSILEEITQKKIVSIINKKKQIPLKKIINSKSNYTKIFNFENILKRKNLLITEMKRQSPSGGDLDKNLNPSVQAKTYIESGADAISVLTEEDFFKGSNKDLEKVLKISKKEKIPVLQKDFIIDEYQIYESKAIGADCILLIIKILEKEQFIEYFNIANELGLSVLVEIHDEKELEKALLVDLKILGINNRNLETLNTNLNTFEEISQKVPKGIFKIAESGIKNATDALRMINAGANGLLIGESIMKSDNRKKLIQNISLKNDK
jgi:indole-3-glycerol phosphate synthase|tara:strand:- start:13741 stop:14532 length:792 start_codon:yes stop_codon:yes gene_type:complete